jgi:hypothetical protein
MSDERARGEGREERRREEGKREERGKKEKGTRDSDVTMTNSLALLADMFM